MIVGEVLTQRKWRFDVGLSPSTTDFTRSFH
jgi:hypothetical protein